jgi:hypothetical protein
MGAAAGRQASVHATSLTTRCHPLLPPRWSQPVALGHRTVTVGCQKLGGVIQNSTVAGVAPWLTFQCGMRDGKVIASPSRRT